jgi:hypothetical protein
VHDECLTLEVLLHIAFEVISQLDKAEESRWLSPEEFSLCDFLVQQIRSLQLVVEAQGDAPSSTQASISSAQDPLPPQPDVLQLVVAQVSWPKSRLLPMCKMVGRWLI